MVVLAHLQGVAATFRVGRHHHRGPLHEGQGLTHTPSLTPLPLTLYRRRSVGEEKAYSKRRRSRLWPNSTGESEDVGRTRVRPHCDGTGLYRAQIWRSGTHARKQRCMMCEIWAQFQPFKVSIFHAHVVVSGVVTSVESRQMVQQGATLGLARRPQEPRKLHQPSKTPGRGRAGGPTDDLASARALRVPLLTGSKSRRADRPPAVDSEQLPAGTRGAFGARGARAGGRPAEHGVLDRCR